MSQTINPTDIAEARRIRQAIINANTIIRNKYQWLSHQNAIGFGLFSLSIACILGGWCWYAAYSSGLVVVFFWTAFWTSILHELEHDLIHNLYFKNFKPLQNLMFLGVWLFRPTTINPWLRRDVHIHHHQYSGTEIDVEEISITNGEKWSLLRLIITADLIWAYIFRLPRLTANARKLQKEGKYPMELVNKLHGAARFGLLPFGIPAYLMWYFCLGYWLVQYLILPFAQTLILPEWATETYTFCYPVAMLWVAPNIFRQFCLHFITSNMHYFGDVEEGNLLQQTQVLNAWWTLPFQLFCCNFGSTHSIHHFVVNEPFYIRQLSAAAAHRAMRAHGVRFNDMGTFARANRYAIKTAQSSGE